MGRGLAFGRTAWPGVGEVLLGSTHLESFVGEEQRQQVLSSRQAQLRRQLRVPQALMTLRCPASRQQERLWRRLRRWRRVRTQGARKTQ